MPQLGQQIIYRVASSDYRDGVVAEVVSGNTVNLVVFSNGDAWGDGDPGSLASKCYANIAMGTGVGEWQAGTVVSDAIAAAAPNYCAVPGASSTVSLAASTPRQPSATRPVAVMLTGSWSWNLTAIGTQTGSLSFQSDSSATPTTPIFAPSWSRSVTVGITVGDAGTIPVCMTYIVPPGDYYQVVTAGGATFSIREQVL